MEEATDRHLGTLYTIRCQQWPYFDLSKQTNRIQSLVRKEVTDMHLEKKRRANARTDAGTNVRKSKDHPLILLLLLYFECQCHSFL